MLNIILYSKIMSGLSTGRTIIEPAVFSILSCVVRKEWGVTVLRWHVLFTHDHHDWCHTQYLKTIKILASVHYSYLMETPVQSFWYNVTTMKFKTRNSDHCRWIMIRFRWNTWTLSIFTCKPTSFVKWPVHSLRIPHNDHVSHLITSSIRFTYDYIQLSVIFFHLLL